MIAYKLVKRRKDGTIGPLYINAPLRIPVGEWLEAEDHPTKGFAHRPGWHCTFEPVAPHIKMKPEREWWIVEVAEYSTFDRPESQGGTWILADYIRFLEPLE